MADYSKRTHSTQRNSAVSAGYAVDFLHLTGAAESEQIIPARSVVTLTSINVAPASGNVVMLCGSDIVLEASTARDYKQGFYAYAPITVNLPDSTADITIYFSPPSKGSVAGQ